MIRIDRSAIQLPIGYQSIASTTLKKLAQRKKRRKNKRVRSSDFEEKLYKQLRSQLFNAQHMKCCYCERLLEESHETVEHFRPKTNSVRADGSTDEGYWWLAYELDNLLFCCKICNNLKNDKFPLLPGSPTLNVNELPWVPQSGIPPEQQYHIDPGFEDPSSHFTVVDLPTGDIRFCHNQSLRGDTTITDIGLDRDDLHVLRMKHLRKHLRPLKMRFESAVNVGDLVEKNKVQTEALELTTPDAQFSLFSLRVLESWRIL